MPESLSTAIWNHEVVTGPMPRMFVAFISSNGFLLFWAL